MINIKYSAALMLLSSLLISCGETSIAENTTAKKKSESAINEVQETTDSQLSDQRMAASPKELIAALSAVSFKTPKVYQAVLDEEIASVTTPISVGSLKQNIDESTDPRSTITARQIQQHIDKLTGISIQSRDDGNLIWGRIQGTKYERQASEYAEQQMKEYGFTEIYKDKIPARRPLWHLDELEFTVISAPTFSSGKKHRFKNALTAYQSATTPKGGIEAEVVFVGEGTPAELNGRNLTDKLVLLRTRGLPGGLFHSARTAYSRIAIGDHGIPAGVIVWSDVPNATQVATRVGAIGGGENLGLALPWTVINNNDGYYLRKLLDRATKEQPVIAKLNVQGKEEGPDKRYSYNVTGVLPGKSGKYIMLMGHVDGFLYAVHCNAGAVAMNLALAKHYANIPADEREHGLIFLFVGDHENPGVGATDKWLETHENLADNLLVNLRPEKIGIIQDIDEGWITTAHSNVATPGMLMVTNKSPLLVDLFKQASNNYSLTISDFLFSDPAADETNFHPPYVDKGIISAGWTIGSRYYHTTADYENNLVSPKELEKFGRAHAFIIDELGKYSKSDLEEGATRYTAEKSIYQSDTLKLLFGNH